MPQVRFARAMGEQAGGGVSSLRIAWPQSSSHRVGQRRRDPDSEQPSWWYRIRPSAVRWLWQDQRGEGVALRARSSHRPACSDCQFASLRSNAAERVPGRHGFFPWTDGRRGAGDIGRPCVEPEQHAVRHYPLTTAGRADGRTVASPVSKRRPVDFYLARRPLRMELLSTHAVG